MLPKGNGKIHVVCFGGGTGLSSLFSILKDDPRLSISTVVTMFDSGGSSGKLRDRFGILPPGDILRCILALSDVKKDVIREILLRRIPPEWLGEMNTNPDPDVAHTVGNILFLGLQQQYGLQAAVKILSHAFAIKGRVHPVSLHQSDLCAELSDGSIVHTEVHVDKSIAQGNHIKRLFLEPDVLPNEEALEAARQADAFCIGPGSFYTSVLPNFLPKGVCHVVSQSRAPIIFILNLMTEGAGMKGHTAEHIVSNLENTIGRPVDKVIVNSHIPHGRLEEYAKQQKFPIEYDSKADRGRFVYAPLWLDGSLARHDPASLSYVIGSVVYDLVKK